MKSHNNPTLRPFMNHVMLADGNDFPTVQYAFRLSLAASCLLASVIVGSSLGSSTTCIWERLIAVWNSGASSETSQ